MAGGKDLQIQLVDSEPKRADESQSVDFEPTRTDARSPFPEGHMGLVHIETYGCQMNLSDSELIAGVLHERGYRLTSRPEEADVVLLNTCAIRDHAEDRVMGRLSQLRHQKLRRPGLVLGVCGCLAKHLAEQIVHRIPEVDFVVGPDSYRRLPQMISDLTGDPALDVRLDRRENYEGLDPTRVPATNAWVTIMRGCDKFCTFCIVPYVRGRERSSSPDEILRQVEDAAAAGYREVTLLGQTVNSYVYGSADFADLLGKVARVDGIRRIRFTSPHPSGFSDKLIETMAREEKVCRHVHLPVQSGSDSVLAAMKRDYSVQNYTELVDKLRGAMPGLCLSTDIIAGFPGETEADFGATLDLMRALRFDSAFTFRYSQRKGTVAYRELPDTVPEEEKIRRLKETIDVQNRISTEINHTMIGRDVDVLVEGDARKGAGKAVGKSDGFKTVVFDRGSAQDNTFVPVEVTDATSHTLTGIARVEIPAER